MTPPQEENRARAAERERKLPGAHRRPAHTGRQRTDRGNTSMFPPWLLLFCIPVMGEIKLVTFELLHMTTVDTQSIRTAASRIRQAADHLSGTVLDSVRTGNKISMTTGDAELFRKQIANQRAKADDLEQELDKILQLVGESRVKRSGWINVGGIFRDVFGIASDDDLKQEENRLEDKIAKIYKVRDADKRLMAQVVKKEERLIQDNTMHVQNIRDQMKEVKKMLDKTASAYHVRVEVSDLDYRVDSLYWSAKHTLSNIWRLVDKAMEGRASIDMVTTEDLKEMNNHFSQIKPNLRPAFSGVRDVLQMRTTDILREGDKLLVSMRMPYTDTESFEPSFFGDAVVMVGDTKFAVATPPQWLTCGEGICRERLCLVKKPQDCSVNKPRACIMEAELACRQINPTHFEIVAREDMSFIVNCPGRTKEEHKVKGGEYSTLSIDKVCNVDEATLTIPHQLLSRETTTHGTSEMMRHEDSNLDRLEHTLAESDSRVSNLSAEIKATRQNMSKVEMETDGLHSKQQEHEDMMMSISEDIGQLEGGTGYIPEHVQEHTTITVTGVVFVVLTILSIALYLIRKKFSKMTEQIGNALRSVTP